MDNNDTLIHTTFRLSPRTIQRLTDIAKQEKRSISQMIRLAIDRLLNQWDTEQSTNLMDGSLPTRRILTNNQPEEN